MRDKPVAHIDDVLLILNHHWVLDTEAYPDGQQRLQVALLILLMVYTASRPGAILYLLKNIEENLCISVGA